MVDEVKTLRAGEASVFYGPNVQGAEPLVQPGGYFTGIKTAVKDSRSLKGVNLFSGIQHVNAGHIASAGSIQVGKSPVFYQHAAQIAEKAEQAITHVKSV